MLVNIACDRAQVRTVSGDDWSLLGPLVKVGRYEFTSHAGDVRLTLAGTQGFELAAKTFSGGVHSELPLTIGTDRPAHAARRRPNAATCAAPSATAARWSIVKTFSGSVAIARAGSRESRSGRRSRTAREARTTARRPEPPEPPEQPEKPQDA